jgi:hypothetical protein
MSIAEDRAAEQGTEVVSAYSASRTFHLVRLSRAHLDEIAALTKARITWVSVARGIGSVDPSEESKPKQKPRFLVYRHKQSRSLDELGNAMPAGRLPHLEATMK